MTELTKEQQILRSTEELGCSPYTEDLEKLRKTLIAVIHSATLPEQLRLAAGLLDEGMPLPARLIAEGVVNALAGTKGRPWYRVPQLPLVEGADVDLPDSDVRVLACTDDGEDYVLVQLKFTDDSEGHGEPYWSAEGGDLPLCNYPLWMHIPPRTNVKVG